MSFQTCNVTGKILSPNGAPEKNAVILAVLSQKVQYHGLVIPEQISTRTLGDGTFSLDLWPNVLLTDPVTWYDIIITTDDTWLESFKIVVPNEDTANLFSIKDTDIPSGGEDELKRFLAMIHDLELKVDQDATDAEEAAKDAMSSAASVKKDATTAQNAAASAQTAMQTATDASVAAKDSETAAGTSETNARNFATSAAGSATKAEASATASKTSATEATAAATEAKEAEKDGEGTLKDIRGIETHIDDIWNKIQQHTGGSTSKSYVLYKTEYVYIAFTGQKDFSGADVTGQVLSYIPGKVLVFRNGFLQRPVVEYDSRDGTVLRLKDGCAPDDIVIIVAFSDASAPAPEVPLNALEDEQGNAIPPFKTNVFAYVWRPLIRDIVTFQPVKKKSLYIKLTVIGEGGRGDSRTGGGGGEVLIWSGEMHSDSLFRIEFKEPAGIGKGGYLDIQHQRSGAVVQQGEVACGNDGLLAPPEQAKTIPSDQFPDASYFPGGKGGVKVKAGFSPGAGGGGSGGCMGYSPTTASSGSGGCGFGGGGAGGSDIPRKNDPVHTIGSSTLIEYMTDGEKNAMNIHIDGDGIDGMLGGGGGQAGVRMNGSPGLAGLGGKALVLVEVLI